MNHETFITLNFLLFLLSSSDPFLKSKSHRLIELKWRHPKRVFLVQFIKLCTVSNLIRIFFHLTIILIFPFPTFYSLGSSNVFKPWRQLQIAKIYPAGKLLQKWIRYLKFRLLWWNPSINWLLVACLLWTNSKRMLPRNLSRLKLSLTHVENQSLLPFLFPLLWQAFFAFCQLFQLSLLGDSLYFDISFLH
jgi:hypothetical protein